MTARDPLPTFGRFAREPDRAPEVEAAVSQAPSDSRSTGTALWVNGERRCVTADTGELSVAGLIEALDLGGRRVAVAVNGEVVPRSGFTGRRLAADDRVEILEAVGGG